MKKIVLMAASLLFLTEIAQSQVIIGLKLSPNVTALHIKDHNGTSSAINYVADGSTTNEGNQKGISGGANFDFPINDTWYFSTGAWLTSRSLFVRNTDGNYSGTSKYNLLYSQIPVLLKYRTGEVFTKKLNLVFSGGGMFDFKLKESLNGGDGAHYWNLAKNLTYLDPTRGQNGNNTSMALFAPINVGMYISAGAEYQLLDKIAVYAGFSVNPSFMNMINPKLTFNDPGKTPVRTDVRFTNTVISFDLAVMLKQK